MKKLLALVLALVMVMSLCITSNAAYSDAADIDYKEAVDVMTAIGVLEGSDGKFDPDAQLTRAQAAKIIAYLELGNKVAASLQGSGTVFTDVPASHWAAGYIEYLASVGVLAGVGDGKFDPNGALTNAAFAKMLLVVLGCDADADGLVGASWVVKTAKLANQSKLFKGVDNSINAVATREEAALYAFNALTEGGCYTGATTGTKVEINGATIATGMAASKWNNEAEDNKINDYMDAKKLGMAESKVDEYGRPAVTWTYNGKDVGTYAETADFVFTAKTKTADVASKLAGYKFKETEITDKKDDATAKAIADLTGNGVVVELFADSEKNLAYVDYYAALTKVTKIDKDIAKTEGDERAITLGGSVKKVVDKKLVADKETVTGTEIDNFDEIYANVKVDDYVLVTTVKSKIVDVKLPTIVEGKITKVDDGKVTMDGTVYELAKGATTPAAKKAAQKVWLDSYGYIVMTEEVADEASDIVYVTNLFTAPADKYGKSVVTLEFVTAEGEKVEKEVASTLELVKEDIVNKIFTYITNSDGEIESLDDAAESKYVGLGKKALTAKDLKVNGTYYADAKAVTFIFINKNDAKMTVTTATGAQAVAAEKLGDGYALLDKDGKYVTTVFVRGAADTAVKADELVFVAKDQKEADAGAALDLKDNAGKLFTFYINGVKKTEIVDVTKGATLNTGWYTCTVDSETGVYTLKGTSDKAVAATTEYTVELDQYFTCGSTVVDYTLDCEIFDLTENEIAGSLDLLDDEDVVGEVAVAFTYDTTDKVITSMYVVDVAGK